MTNMSLERNVWSVKSHEFSQSLNIVRVEFALLPVSQAASSWVSDVLFMMFINELSRC